MGDVRIKLQEKWLPAHDYQIEAFINFLTHGKSFYSNKNYMFRIERKENNCIYMVKEDGSLQQIDDFSILKGYSNNWKEARHQKAFYPFKVPYMNTQVFIERNSSYYSDSKGDVLIGFHGSFNPPLDMGSNSLIS